MREQRTGGLESDAARTDRPHPTPTRLGPLLAVCGLVGSAGTTTLAYLVALAAARQLDDPVLVADTGGPSGGLAAIAGVAAPRSLPELASRLATGVPLREGIYATGPAGVRVLAAGPQFTSSPPDGPLRRILGDARGAHGLTVIDCGTLGREVDRATAAAATHIAWVTLATNAATDSGLRVLDAAPYMPGKELLIARRELRQPKAPLKELRRIAAQRGAPLVVVPHLGSLIHGRAERAAEEAQVALQAILGLVRR